MDATNALGGLVPVTPTEPSAESRALFPTVHALVNALIEERERIMDALIGLVNASHPYRHSAVCLANQQAMGPAWQVAYALCEAWSRSPAAAVAAARAAAAEKKEIVIPVIGGDQ